MTLIVQSYFDTLLRYVLSVTFCGAVVMKGMDQKTLLKVSSRVKHHHFSKFAIFRLLNRAHQELSFKKIPRKNVTKVFSMLVILIDR